MFFLDEIHRFNKAQQDALLPAVEDGLITLIGATTENPAFEVNGALLSRTRVYALQALSDEEVGTVLRRAVAQDQAPKDEDSGSLDGSRNAEIEVDEDAIDFLAARSEGDARTALNALELALATAAELGEGSVTIARAEDALQRRAVLYDKGGDRHYDYISAWIKATRGSDPDASLYYLAVMLEGGEDPRFIVRRMVILASEDIGNADPGALGSGGRRGGRRSSTWGCRRPNSRSRKRRSTSRWRRSRTRPGARWGRRSGTCASMAQRRCRGGCGRVRGRDRMRTRPPVTTIPTTIPGTSPRRSCCPRGSSGSASTSRTRPRRSWHGGWRRFASCAGDSGSRRARGQHHPHACDNT